jgi:hypothetical protein
MSSKPSNYFFLEVSIFESTGFMISKANNKKITTEKMMINITIFLTGT